MWKTCWKLNVPVFGDILQITDLALQQPGVYQKTVFETGKDPFSGQRMVRFSILFHQIPYRYRIRQPYAVLRNKKRESIRLHPARLHFKDHRRAVPLSDFQRSILIRAQVDMMPGAFYQAGSQNAVDVLAPCTVVQYRRRDPAAHIPVRPERNAPGWP